MIVRKRLLESELQSSVLVVLNSPKIEAKANRSEMKYLPKDSLKQNNPEG
jgi:hypothetical protein